MEEDKKISNDGVLKVVESALVSIAASIPIAASLAAGWNEYKNYKQTEHIKELISNYIKRLSEIEESIDKEYLKSTEAKNLIERTAIIGKDEIRKEKRKMLSEFLANASTKALSPDAEKDMVLDTIDRISSMQCEILKGVTETLVGTWGRENVRLGSNYNPDDKDKPTFGYIVEATIIEAMSADATKENIEASLDYMQSIGVIEVHSVRGWSTVGGKMGIRGYRPTKLGLKILEYLGMAIENMEEHVALAKQ